MCNFLFDNTVDVIFDLVMDESKPEADKNKQPEILPSSSVESEGEVKTPILNKIPKVKRNSMPIIIGSLLVVTFGIVTGWFLSGMNFAGDGSAPKDIAPGGEVSETEAGIEDETAFRDSAEGVLLEGGIDGEGTHYLDRNLGADKYVYLNSTVIDLQSFVNKKVVVWGETTSAQKAGWLMDVGKLKVIE